MGLFQKIFGKKTEPVATQGYYKLLNTWQSTFTPFSGNAYEVNTVVAAIDAFARRAAQVQPRHIRRSGGEIINVADSKHNRLLQIQPNPYTTAYQFLYRIATQYKLYNNAFVFPVWNPVTYEIEAYYNVNATSIELKEVDGEPYALMTFANGNKYMCPYADLIHIGSHFNGNDFFGENNRPITPVLATANTFNQSMAKSAELVAVIHGILEVNGATKDADISFQRDRFIRDNLSIENNGSGVIVTDQKNKYTHIQDKQTPIPTGQLAYIKGEIYDYFGTNDAIIQNKETPEQADAYYNSEIKPFFEQLTQAFTAACFTGRELGYGNMIVFEGETLQNTRISDKKVVLEFLANIGAVCVDDVRVMFGMAPLGGEEGARRVQTLNMVNAAKADEYQLGDEGGEDDDPPEDTDPPEDDEKKKRRRNNNAVYTR